jgi:hypothetical protein
MAPQSLRVDVISVITESSVGMTVSNCLWVRERGEGDITLLRYTYRAHGLKDTLTRQIMTRCHYERLVQEALSLRSATVTLISMFV